MVEGARICRIVGSPEWAPGSLPWSVYAGMRTSQDGDRPLLFDVPKAHAETINWRVFHDAVRVTWLTKGSDMNVLDSTIAAELIGLPDRLRLMLLWEQRKKIVDDAHY